MFVLYSICMYKYEPEDDVRRCSKSIEHILDPTYSVAIENVAFSEFVRNGRIVHRECVYSL